MSDQRSIRVAVSACLLGQRVRYDGDHKLASVIVDELCESFELVPVCPEMELGLGVPRPPIRLVGPAGRTAMIVADDRRDIAPQMRAYADARVRELVGMGIAGYVLKSRSPSCAVASAMRFESMDDGVPSDREARGVFVERLLAAAPELPTVEETSLTDRDACSTFGQRVMDYFAEHLG